MTMHRRLIRNRLHAAVCALLVLQLGLAPAAMSHSAGDRQAEVESMPPCHGEAPASSDHGLPCCAAGQCHCAAPSMAAPVSWRPLLSAVSAGVTSTAKPAALSPDPSRLLRPPIPA